MEKYRRVSEGEDKPWGTPEQPQTVHQIRAEWIRGMNYAQIARKHRIDPRTAKRYAVGNLSLEELGHRSRSMLDPYRQVIGLWMSEHDISIAKIQRRLCYRCGVKCGYMTVSNYVDKLRKAGILSGIFSEEEN